MGATVNTSTRKNYYSVSYGYFAGSVSNEPTDRKLISQADIKASYDNFSSIRLEKYFVDTGKAEYRYRLFYNQIVGFLQDFYLEDSDYGKLLKLEILDTDGETNVVSMRALSRYAIDVLNRILNMDQRFARFSPFSIPDVFEGNNFFNAGIVMYHSDEKIPGKLKGEDMPPKVEMEREDGTQFFSNKDRANKLYPLAQAHFKTLLEKEPLSITEEATDTESKAIESSPNVNTEDKLDKMLKGFPKAPEKAVSKEKTEAVGTNDDDLPF